MGPKEKHHSEFFFSFKSVPEFIDPIFCENKPQTLVFNDWKRAFWACFREKWVNKFGHCSLEIFTLDFRKCVFGTSKEVTSFTEYGSMELFISLNMVPVPWELFISLNMVPWSDFFHWLWFPGVTYFTEYGSIEWPLSLRMGPSSDFFHWIWFPGVASFTEYGSTELIRRGALISIEKRFLCGKWFPTEPWSL